MQVYGAFINTSVSATQQLDITNIFGVYIYTAW